MSDLAAPGATSTENGYELLGGLSSLADALRGIGTSTVDIAGSVFGTIRGVQDAINPPDNPNVTQGVTQSANPIAGALPSNLQGFATTDNLLIAGGLALGGIGLFIALKG